MTNTMLDVAARALMDAQEPLEADFERVLMENLSQIYEDDTALASGSGEKET